MGRHLEVTFLLNCYIVKFIFKVTSIYIFIGLAFIIKWFIILVD